jgi:hypothetical protein
LSLWVGLGGGAARIAVQSCGAPPPSALTDAQAALNPTGEPSLDSGKKRKAEKDAASSPLPLLSVATSTTKRRQSPPIEAISLGRVVGIWVQAPLLWVAHMGLSLEECETSSIRGPPASIHC